MGKHKKHLREEKSKVKLKKTLLPKGQNVTDTSFKVKRIVVLEQLPTHDGEIRTSNNHNLKELLNILQHHNVNSKLSGLHGIKELFSNYPSLINGLDLLKVVSKIVELIIDADTGKVRKAACSLLNHIISMLPLEKQIPLIPLLTRQILRGLSHLQPTIQKDCLVLLDLLLDITPSTNYTNLECLTAPLIRMLDTTADLETRLRVVKRISTLFGKFTESLETESIFQEVNYTARIGHLTSIYKSIPKLNILNTNQQQQPFRDLKTQLEKLVPIVLGIWTEVSPTERNITDVIGRLLTQLSQLIKSIIALIDLQMENPDSYFLKEWFVGEFRNKLTKILFDGFPYYISSNANTNKQSRQADYHFDIFCKGALDELNYNLVFIFRWLKIRNANLDSRISAFEENPIHCGLFC